MGYWAEQQNAPREQGELSAPTLGSPRGRLALRGLSYRDGVDSLSPANQPTFDVQRRALSPAQGAAVENIHGAARDGVRAGGGALPHLAQIQAAFGRHDVTGIRSHVGGGATKACHAMGAQAYASGVAVAFATAPSLHLAAHEAAHVVQQRGGVALSGGVGRAGDRYERHADEVADLVVQGKSAEQVLDQFSGASQVASTAVQRQEGSQGTDAATSEAEAFEELLDFLLEHNRLTASRDSLRWLLKGGQMLLSDLFYTDGETVDIRDSPDDCLIALNSWRPDIEKFQGIMGFSVDGILTSREVNAAEAVRADPWKLITSDRARFDWYIAEGGALLRKLGFDWAEDLTSTTSDSVFEWRVDIEAFQEAAGITADGRLDVKTKTLIEVMSAQVATEPIHQTPQEIGRAQREALLAFERLDAKTLRTLAADANRGHSKRPEWVLLLHTMNRPGPELSGDDMKSLARIQRRFGLKPNGVLTETFWKALRQKYAPDLDDPELAGAQGDAVGSGTLETGVSGRRTGALFVNGISAQDVRQGNIGDCALMAALASAANQDPSAIRSMFKDNGDGTYSVRYYQALPVGGFLPHWYRVDTDLFSGFARSNDWTPDRGFELWPRLAEKAAAIHFTRHPLRGDDGEGYETISGGNSERLAAVLGRGTSKTDLGAMRLTSGHHGYVLETISNYMKIRDALAAGQSVMCGTPHMWGAELFDKRALGSAPPLMKSWMFDMFVNEEIVDLSVIDRPRMSLKLIRDYLKSRGSSDYNARLNKSHSPVMTWYLNDIRAHREKVASWDSYFKKGKVFQAGVLDTLSNSYRQRHAQEQRNELKDYTWSLAHYEGIVERFETGARSGVVRKHAYAVLDAFEAAEELFVKVFNPHNANEGGVKGALDGVFVINMDEFMRTFASYTIV